MILDTPEKKEYHNATRQVNRCRKRVEQAQAQGKELDEIEKLEAKLKDAQERQLEAREKLNAEKVRKENKERENTQSYLTNKTTTAEIENKSFVLSESQAVFNPTRPETKEPQTEEPPKVSNSTPSQKFPSPPLSTEETQPPTHKTKSTIPPQVVPKKIIFILDRDSGNSMRILTSFRREAMEQGWTEKEVAKVAREAIKGNYLHICDVLAAHSVNDGLSVEEYQAKNKGEGEIRINTNRIFKNSSMSLNGLPIQEPPKDPLEAPKCHRCESKDNLTKYNDSDPFWACSKCEQEEWEMYEDFEREERAEYNGAVCGHSLPEETKQEMVKNSKHYSEVKDKELSDQEEETKDPCEICGSFEDTVDISEDWEESQFFCQTCIDSVTDDDEEDFDPVDREKTTLTILPTKEQAIEATKESYEQATGMPFDDLKVYQTKMIAEKEFFKLAHSFTTKDGVLFVIFHDDLSKLAQYIPTAQPSKHNEIIQYHGSFWRLLNKDTQTVDSIRSIFPSFLQKEEPNTKEEKAIISEPANKPISKFSGDKVEIELKVPNGEKKTVRINRESIPSSSDPITSENDPISPSKDLKYNFEKREYLKPNEIEPPRVFTQNGDILPPKDSNLPPKESELSSLDPKTPIQEFKSGKKPKESKRDIKAKENTVRKNAIKDIEGNFEKFKELEDNSPSMIENSGYIPQKPHGILKVFDPNSDKMREVTKIEPQEQVTIEPTQDQDKTGSIDPKMTPLEGEIPAPKQQNTYSKIGNVEDLEDSGRGYFTIHLDKLRAGDTVCVIVDSLVYLEGDHLVIKHADRYLKDELKQLKEDSKDLLNNLISLGKEVQLHLKDRQLQSENDQLPESLENTGSEEIALEDDEINRSESTINQSENPSSFTKEENFQNSNSFSDSKQSIFSQNSPIFTNNSQSLINVEVQRNGLNDDEIHLEPIQSSQEKEESFQVFQANYTENDPISHSISETPINTGSQEIGQKKEQLQDQKEEKHLNGMVFPSGKFASDPSIKSFFKDGSHLEYPPFIPISPIKPPIDLSKPKEFWVAQRAHVLAIELKTPFETAYKTAVWEWNSHVKSLLIE